MTPEPKPPTCLYCRPEKACWSCLPQTSYLDVARAEVARREAAAKTETAPLSLAG